MFGRKKQAYTHYPTHTPPPISRPVVPEAQAEPLPRRCPLTQGACRDTCAWIVEGECAAAYLAREVYTMVEVLARSRRLAMGTGESSPNHSAASPAAVDEGLPFGTVVLPQAE